MLFVTFTRVKMKELKVQKVHLGQLVFQIVGGVVLYLLLKWCGVNEIVCQGVMICAFIPTAMASVVVGGMMGGNVSTMTTFMLLSHMTMALVAPVVFSLMGSGVEMPFLTSFWLVFRKLLLLVVAPFVAAQLLGVVAPKGFEWVQKRQSLSFYLWLSSLVIIIASTTEYILAQPLENLRLEIAMALLSGVPFAPIGDDPKISAFSEMTLGVRSISPQNFANEQMLASEIERYLELCRRFYARGGRERFIARQRMLFEDDTEAFAAFCADGRGCGSPPTGLRAPPLRHASRATSPSRARL
jgi:hypothetical protein